MSHHHHKQIHFSQSQSTLKHHPILPVTQWWKMQSFIFGSKRTGRFLVLVPDMEGRMEEKQKVQKQAAVREQLVLMEPAAAGEAEPPLPRHRIPDFYSDPQGVMDGGNLKVEITKSKSLKAMYLGLKLTSLKIVLDPIRNTRKTIQWIHIYRNWPKDKALHLIYKRIIWAPFNHGIFYSVFSTILTSLLPNGSWLELVCWTSCCMFSAFSQRQEGFGFRRRVLMSLGVSPLPLVAFLNAH